MTTITVLDGTSTPRTYYVFQDGSGNYFHAQGIYGLVGDFQADVTSSHQLLVTGPVNIVSGGIASGAAVAGSFVDGAIATLGSQADAAWVSGSGSAISVLKKIAGNTTPGASSVSLASGAVQSGAYAAGSIGAGAAVSGAFLAGSIADLTHGQATMVNSVPVVIASNQSGVPVTQASGTIASGAFASGSISAGAAVSGAFVAGAIADLAHGQGTMAASVPVVIASNQSSLPVTTTPKTASFVLAGATVGVTSAQALAASTAVNHLSIQNTSTTANIAICFGSAAVLNSNGSLMLGPGQSSLWGPTTAGVPSGAMNAIASVASTPLYIEYN